MTISTSLNFQKHGSLSIPVNFHALYSYVKLTGGSVLKQKQSSNLYTSMIIYSNNDLIYTKSNFNQTIYSYPVSSLYKNKDNADKEIKMSFNKIVKEIYLSNFCPFVILKSYQELLDASSKFKKNKIKLIYFICQTISKNTYQCEGEQQPYEKIANLFFMNNHFIEARDSYHKFLKLNPKDFKATYNYALCHYKLNHPLKALSSFQKAASIKRTLDTDYWISKIMNNQKLTL